MCIPCYIVLETQLQILEECLQPLDLFLLPMVKPSLRNFLGGSVIDFMGELHDL